MAHFVNGEPASYEVQIARLAFDLGKLPTELLEEDAQWIDYLLNYKEMEAVGLNIARQKNRFYSEAR